MKQKWVKRIARAMLPCFLFFVFAFSFAPKAHAVEANITANVGMISNYLNKDNDATGSHYWTDSVTTPVTNLSAGGNYLGYNFDTWNDFYFADTSGVNYNGLTKVYASYRFNTGRSLTSRFWTNSTWNILFTNDYGQTAEGVVDKFISFDDSSGFQGKGYALEAAYVADEGHPIKNLRILRNEREGVFQTQQTDAPSIYVISCRVITTAFSAEMDQLDNIADEITAQSDILLAMKGDIVAILQDIYQMTGDIKTAQNLLNSYVSQMLPLLTSINSTTSNIYSLLSTQLRLLETAIENAADSVEAAIAAQTAAMIAYFEQYFNTGNEVPDDTYQQQQDAANILDQMESLEKPNVDTIVPEIGDYTDSGVSGVLSAIFSSNLIVTMMTLSASFAFGAYVLFGKRE